MAALNRPTRATYEVHETVKVDTLDNEDHTFCGIMFPVKAKEILPVDRLVIRSVAVRGQLGPMTVWVTNEDAAAAPDPRTGEYRFRLHPRHWTKVYDKVHSPSSRAYVPLQLTEPVVLRPGQIRALYVHSRLDGDEAIVYDNSRGLGVPGLRRPGERGTATAAAAHRRWEDSRLAIMSGKAHLSNTPFDQTPIWGWGNGWRDHREFVGQIEYGVVYRLWHPERHLDYGDNFRAATVRLLACQRRRDSVLASLPDECVYYVLHMCRWDWFGDAADGLRVRRRLLRARRRARERERLEQERLERERAEQRRAEVAASDRRGWRACQASPGSTTAPAAAADANYDAEAEADSDDDETDDGDMEDASGSAGGVQAAGVAAVAPAPADNPPAADRDSDSDDESTANHNDNNDNRHRHRDSSDSESDGGNDSNESEWERANGYRADGTVLSCRDLSSDDEAEDDAAAARGWVGGAPRDPAERRDWFRRNLARIHILRALAGGAAQDGEA